MTRTVLLVEDERDTREMLGRSLERAGYTCLLAGNPSDALARVGADGPIAIAVTDIVLEGDERGGLHLMTALRAAGVRAPVVMITAYADVEKVKFALNEGAAYLLEKPFRADELVSVVARVLGQEGGIESAVDRIFAEAGLTDKERAVARHLLEGLSSTEIAEVEGNSPKTIRQHVSQIYAKCGVGSRAEFFRLAFMR